MQNLKVKKGYIMVSRGLKLCHRYWLIRSYCLYSKTAYVILSQLPPLKSAEQSITSIANNVTKDYVGETARLLETRIKEHLSRNSSAVNEHCKLTGHSVDSSKIKVLATENNTFKRRIREAIEIKLRKPSLNRDNGFELASICDTILAPWRPLYNPS